MAIKSPIAKNLYFARNKQIAMIILTTNKDKLIIVDSRLFTKKCVRRNDKGKINKTLAIRNPKKLTITSR